MHVQHKKRTVPSLNAAWDYMAEEDKKAIEEIVKRYTAIAKKSEDIALIDRFYKE